MSTYLPLRYDILNKEKQLLEQVMVIELIELKEPAHILVEAKKQPWPAVVEQAKRPDGHTWTFSWLPKGFIVAVRDNHRLIGSHEPVEYLALTDGLANISVYVSKPGEQPLPEELMTRNGLSMVVEKLAEHEVVAVGKVPHETLKRIAKGLVLK